MQTHCVNNFDPADGFDNWRLPTINELKLIYNERDKISGLHQNDLYWSSSIAGNGYASLINFGNGATNYKYNTKQGTHFMHGPFGNFNR